MNTATSPATDQERIDAMLDAASHLIQSPFVALLVVMAAVAVIALFGRYL